VKSPSLASDLRKDASELLPLASITALVLVSIFNIGYFSDIGLHFLGLIDLTNIVYSVGLVFGGLIAAINFLFGAIDILLKFARDDETAKRLYRYIRIAATIGLLTLTALTLLPKAYQISGLDSRLYFTIVFSSIFSLVVFRILLRSKQGQQQKLSEFVLAILALTSADVSLGKLVANRQITQQSQVYTVTTKSGTLYGVTLIRSSSSGFIVSYEGRISFISKDEVKFIRSESLSASIDEKNHYLG